jgi:hypothetical protein
VASSPGLPVNSEDSLDMINGLSAEDER